MKSLLILSNILFLLASSSIAATAPAGEANFTNVQGFSTSQCAPQTLYVCSYTLTAAQSGKTITATSAITITDGPNRPSSISSATVTVSWTLPNGSVVTKSGLTNSSGAVSFTQTCTTGSTPKDYTFKIKITGVTKPGYTLTGSLPAQKTVTKRG